MMMMNGLRACSDHIIDAIFDFFFDFYYDDVDDVDD
jgi:hypothetical protein